jgi:hypothetical protein
MQSGRSLRAFRRTVLRLSQGRRANEIAGYLTYLNCDLFKVAVHVFI